MRMSRIGEGYGSEYHLLRYLGRHRETLNRKIRQATGADDIYWLDNSFDSSGRFRDREWTGLDFLSNSSNVLAEWSRFWPQRGNPPNWDAIGKLIYPGREEWLLVEGKANEKELKSPCHGKSASWEMIEKAFSQTKAALG